MIYIRFNGASSLLVLTEPDPGVAAPRVRLDTPGDVLPANYAQESRRVFARSLRYQLSYSIQTTSLAETTAVRQALNIWKSQPVLCPLWTDAIETAVTLNAGSTLIPVATTPGPPARSAQDWIVLNEATQVYELVQVASVDNAGLHLSGGGLTLSWPTGTRAYPLIIGRFSPRPELQAITGERATGTFVIIEDSDITRALWPNAPAPAAVGAAVPELATLPLWTVPPDWSEPTDTSEADVMTTDEVIGFGRQTQRADYPQAARRRFQMDFAATDRATMARIEAFWFSRRGRTKPFAAPTWRADLELAQDVTTGASSIVVQATAWTNPDYAAHPGAAFLSLIDDSTFAVEPVRVTEIGLGEIDLRSPTAGSYPAATTLVSHLLLCRFAGETLEWEYTSPVLARTTLSFVEMSGEYATPIADLPEPVFLYQFRTTLPNGLTTAWYFTSYESSVVIAGQTYAPAPFAHKEVKSTLKLDQEQIKLASWAFAGNPLGLLMPFALEAPLIFTLLEADARDLTVTPRVVFEGEIWDCTPKGKSLEATALAFGRVFERKFPRALLQPLCNKMQYSPPCGLNPDDWRRAGTVASVSAAATQLGVTLSGGAVAAGAFAGGWLEIGVGAAAQVRDILDSTAGGNVTLSLNRPVSGAAVGSAVGLVPSCGNTSAGCQAFANYGSFFGFEFVPTTSPTIQAVPSAGTGGGKK